MIKRHTRAHAKDQDVARILNRLFRADGLYVDRDILWCSVDLPAELGLKLDHCQALRDGSKRRPHIPAALRLNLQALGVCPNPRDLSQQCRAIGQIFSAQLAMQPWR